MVKLDKLASMVEGHLASMRNRFYSHPEDFPTAYYLPGCRGARFRLSDLDAWLESYRSSSAPASTPAPVTKPTKGRPRKASAAQIASARARQGKGGVA